MQLSRSPQDPARFNVAPWLWKGAGMLCLLSAVGCGGGGSSGGSPTPVVTPTTSPTTTPTTSPSSSPSTAPTTAPNYGTLFAAAPGNPGTVVAYSASATGSPAPTYTIMSTDFNSPRGLTTDTNGALYVVNQYGTNGSSTNVVVFAKGSQTPSKTITSTSLSGTQTGIVVDKPGNVYVLGQVEVTNIGQTYGVAVFSPTANGNSTPITTFTNQGQFVPVALAVDGSPTAPNIYVASNDATPTTTYPYNELQEFPNGSNGSVSPSNTITGSATQLGTGGLNGIALDTAGNIYASVTASTGNVTSVVIFPSGSTGNAAPGRVLSGSLTNLVNPSFMAFDSAGELYVQNTPPTGSPYVTVYPANVNGNTAPLRTITQSTITASGGGIAVASP